MAVRCELKFRHEGTCLASQGSPSDAQQLSRGTEFSIRTEQPLWILLLAYPGFLRQMHLSFYLHYFISFTLKYPYTVEKYSVRLLSTTLTSKRLAKYAFPCTGQSRGNSCREGITTYIVNTLDVYEVVKMLGIDVIATSHTTSTFNMADVNV